MNITSQANMAGKVARPIVPNQAKQQAPRMYGMNSGRPSITPTLAKMSVANSGKAATLSMSACSRLGINAANSNYSARMP